MIDTLEDKKNCTQLDLLYLKCIVFLKLVPVKS
jgi:hypothetical protein